MKKNGAIWVALVVVAVAALLMYFVVLPQVGGNKAIDDLAKKAGETLDQASDTAQKTLDQAVGAKDQAVDKAKSTVADESATLKAGLLQKMARIQSDGQDATVKFAALLADARQPTAEQLAEARAKLAAALTSAKALTAPAGLDKATTDLIGNLSAGAGKALDLLNAIPTDVAGARKAYDGIKATIAAALAGQPLPALPDATQAADSADAAQNASQPDEAAGLPSFDVLRVEKDGSTVIAGKAAPNSKIEIVDGGKVIASTQTGDSGDFVAVLDNPLGVGDHQLVLRATAKDGKTATSLEVATVSVPKDKSGELLAMVSKPGEASRILEMPGAKAEVTPETTVAANTDTKAADQATKSATAEPQAKASDVANADDAAKATDTAAAKTADTTADQAAAKPAVSESADQSAKNAPAVEPDTTKVAEATQADVSKVDAAKSADNADAKVASQPEAAKDSDDSASQATAEAKQQVAADTSAAAKMAKPEVLVNAVEIEGDKLFVAGSTRPKAMVRVYADDKLVAEIGADENGRFVADNRLPLTVGDHTIRADVLSKDGKRVEYRASVPFFRPVGTQLAAVASDSVTPDKNAMQPLADGEYDKARQEASKAVALLKGLYVAGRSPTLDELAAARSATEIALKTLSQIKLGAGDDPVAKEMADKTANQAAKALALLKALPEDASSVKTALNSIDAAVTSAVGPAMKSSVAEKTVPATQDATTGELKVAKAEDTTKDAGQNQTSDKGKVEPDNSAAAAQKTSQALATPETTIASADDAQPKTIEQAPLKPSDASSVIIRRGDTLWQISRRVYGLGVRYTTIYLANEDQIADPDRIMPGQIFGVPVKYLPNAEELHRERIDHKKH
jgi:nucleoid-associated protein YgaU